VAQDGGSAAPLSPVVPERPQPRERLPILDAVGRRLAGDDVVGVAHGEPLDVDTSGPCIREPLDAVRREDEVEVERTVLELDEVLSPEDLGRLGIGEGESQLADCGDQRRAVLGVAFDEQLGVLRRVWKPEEDGPRLADEEVPNAMTGESVADFLRLSVLKRGHNPATPGVRPRTTPGSHPSCRTRETARRPARAGRS